MKVRDLIEYLKSYNENADVGVIVYNKIEEFSITFNGSDGGSKKDASGVNFYVDRLCRNEAAKQIQNGEHFKTIFEILGED